MNIIIGTTIRDVKGYSIGRWLKAIAALEWDTPIPLLMADNTDDTKQADFGTFVVSKVSEVNLDSKQNPYELIQAEDVYGLEVEPRLVKSRENLRKRILELNPDVWFSLECDVLVPPNALKVLTPYLDVFDVVNHCYPDRDNKRQEVGGIGCSLFKASLFEKYDFLDGGGYAYCDPFQSNCYYSGDSWFMQRLLRDQVKMVDFHNLIDIQHLGESE